MRPRSAVLRVHTLALAAVLGLVTGAGAQQIEGVALGPEGEPLSDLPVALHRLGGGMGASVGTATTDPAGRFSFTIEAADSAMYFAIIRHEGSMYIGPPIRGGVEGVIDYEVRAVPEAEAGAVAGALSASTPPGSMAGAPAAGPAGGLGGGASDTGALLLAGMLALAAAAAFLATAPGYRRRRTRTALVELATLENQLEAGVGDDQRGSLEQRRTALRSRLAPRG